MDGQALQGITGFSIVTAGLDRLVRFYREVLRRKARNSGSAPPSWRCSGCPVQAVAPT